MSKINSQVKLLKERGLWKYCHVLFLKIAKFLRIGFYFPDTSPKEVDIVYVVHEKDFGKLNKSIASLKFIKNVSIKTIFIISNNSRKIQTLIYDHRATAIDDNSILGFAIDRYPYPTEKNLPDRSGWLFQQLIKLGWSLHSKSENYIVIDADTYFLQPISFFDKRGRFIFFCVEEWWLPYFKSFKVLFNYKHVVIWSRVAHMMIFNTHYVQKMLHELESIHGGTWHDAIAKTRIVDSHSCFSEFETYANWMLINHPKLCTARPSYNQGVSFENPSINLTGTISVSNHSYLN
jgi:hypothetical protein